MRKQLLSTLLLGATILSMVAPALAENPRYKLYDPQAKKTTYAPMMTVGGSTESGYYIAFLDRAINNVPCVVDNSSLNRNSQGLLGGKCLLLYRDRLIGWRELSAGSYYSEVRAIENERRQEGMYMEKFSTR